MLMSKSVNEEGASGKGSTWVEEDVTLTVPFGWLLGGTESHSLRGLGLSAL